MIEHLEDEVRDELQSSRYGQPPAVAVMHVNGNRLEVLGRVELNGKVRFGYSYCGTRMERQTLLKLVCPETACPCRTRIEAQWATHRGIILPSPRRSEASPFAPPLLEEVELRVNGRCCQARSAQFRCLTPCPHSTHSAIHMTKTGWDLFEAGRYVAGGLIENPETKTLAPLLPTLEAAKAWLASAGPTSYA